ncbi:hypothetical protein [Chitinophaga ginsengisoli]|uniref:Outer membrane protein with beta-barrel domain n=1 Tax=Chitinophaga ginsengisoli TaxID=363837 RepID=A0A2P8GM26_9BACT|nr:hypothetical protein [Chitinophaga ginsengisoli]PSL35010.1 hypothetical protein CLV42_102584 [Chitinophaga ginsengisoli]
MKQLILLLICITLFRFTANSQTISYRNPQDVDPKPTDIKDADIKGKTVTINRSAALMIRVNNNKDFKTKANDSNGKDIPLDPVPVFLKSGTAQLSFIPGSANIAGSFKVGSPTDGSQLLKVNVTVTTKGFYTATTDIKNGIQFYATGFLEEGPQVVTLKALGTPTKAGTASFNILCGGLTTPTTISIAAGTALTTATVSIDKTGSNCTEFTMEGALQVGKELNSANKLLLKIKPSAKGYYIISTSLKNGYFFSGVFNITTTSVQEIVLTGMGTPQTAGTNTLTITDGTNTCSTDVKVEQQAKDATDFGIVNEVTKIELTDPDNSDKYNIAINEKKSSGDSDDDDDNDNLLAGGSSAYEEAIFNTFGKENIILTPYGIMLNTKIKDNSQYIYGGPNYVHIFLDEMGNSLITGIPQGMPEVQYVVHVIYLEKTSDGKTVSYGIKTTKASFTGTNRIENTRTTVNGELTGKGENKPSLKEYTLVIRTADSDIDFEVYRFLDRKQQKGDLNYTIPMTRSFTANISVGLLNTWLTDPTYSILPDPSNTSLNVAEQEEAHNRGYGTVFATLYTSPITLIKYYVNRSQIKKGRKKLSDINNPVTNAQLHSKNYLYMRPIWERIYPTVGVGISDKVFQNLFFGLNWEFSRGCSFFAGGHFGKVNTFDTSNGFKFEKTNITQEDFNLRTNIDWKVGWAIGASIDFSIIGNLFK